MTLNKRLLGSSLFGVHVVGGIVMVTAFAVATMTTLLAVLSVHVVHGITQRLLLFVGENLGDTGLMLFTQCQDGLTMLGVGLIEGCLLLLAQFSALVNFLAALFHALFHGLTIHALAIVVIRLCGEG